MNQIKWGFLILVMACSSKDKAPLKEPEAPKPYVPEVREFPLNKSVDPCNNFYEYTCSKVRDSFELREDRSIHVFSFSDASERLLEFKKEYFKGLAQSKPQKLKGKTNKGVLSRMHERICQTER